MRQEGKKNLRWNTMKILAVGFLGVILIGAVLLWLPICNEKPISFLDALFTSTTSVCVTGLITIVPKYQFTIVGKVVLLLLIQIGGLGIVACVAAFFMIMRRKITLKERIVIQETYNMDSLGGIGFTVWYDVVDNGKRIRRHEVPRKWWFTRLRLHTKIVLVTSLVLFLLGTILTFILEYNNPDTIGNLSIGQKFMASAFQSVTTRTAGFFTFPQAGMHEETGFLSTILMFIGASPGGTAGGLKTTTFAMLFLAFLTMLRGGHDIECFGRKIDENNFRVGFVAIMLALGVYIIGTTAIAVIEPDNIGFQRIMYETASAFATVGLTADLTTKLHTGSKIVLMILMYIGRVGPMTIALLFAGKVNLKEKLRTLPSERIMIG